MKKRVFTVILLAFFILVSSSLLIPTISASDSDSIEDQLKKLTHYAEEYESGNINFIQLLVYQSAVREKIQEIVGVVSKEEGGILNEEQIRNALGEPNEETRWVWVEKEDHDKKLDRYVPIWKKVVFDGKKIQIRLSAHPSIFKKNNEENLIYRLNFESEFKKPEDQLDIKGKINEIKELAEKFNDNPNSKNANLLAKKSVNAEKTFEPYLKQNHEKCENIMMSIFGSENQREEQKTIVQEIDFYSEDNFEAIARLEMCDDCEWHWINLDIWIDSRGRGFEKIKEQEQKEENFEDTERKREEFRNLVWGLYEIKIKELLKEIKKSLKQEDFGKAFTQRSELQRLTEAWNEKANNIWEEVEEILGPERKKGEEEERRCREAGRENCRFDWDEFDIKRRLMEMEMREENYNKRKDFYLNYFADYNKKDFYFEQKEWEKRLVQTFRIGGGEQCENEKDDDNDGDIDCADSQCQGQRCGYAEIEVRSYEGEIKEDTEDTNIEPIPINITSDSDGSAEGEEPTEPIKSNNTFINEISSITGQVTAEEILERRTSTSNESNGNNNEEGVNESDGNNNEERSETRTKTVPMYCIDQICQVRDEDWVEKGPVCDGICDDNDLCEKDCIKCPELPEIKCEQGTRPKFTRYDKNKCPVEQECVRDTKEKEFCNNTKDCIQPQCGVAECVRLKPGDEKGTCKLTELKECEEAECTDGDERKAMCGEDTIIISMCELGNWIQTETKCEKEVQKIEEKDKEKECGNIGDCKENEVCSLFQCVPIIETEEDEEEEEEKECSEDYDCEDSNQCTNDFCINGNCIHKESEECKKPEEYEDLIELATEKPMQEGEEKPDEEGEEKIIEGGKEQIREEPKEPEVTGNIIFKAIGGVLKNIGITGQVTEDETEPKEDTEPEYPSPPKSEEPPQEDYNEDDNWEDEERERREDEQRDRERQERKERIARCKEESEKQCEERYVEKCVGPCFWNTKCDDEDCLRETRDQCRESCREDNEDEIKECREDCSVTCDQDKWCEIDWGDNTWEEEKGVFGVGGSCRKSQGREEAFIWFNGWGDPFEIIQPLKNKYYETGEDEWCKNDLENYIRQRKEFEKGFNQEFIEWFFEKYMANSAEDWEQHISGIFEIYWRNVDNQRQIAERMNCLGINDIEKVMTLKLINLSYDTEYGSVEYWEELTTVKTDKIFGDFGKKEGERKEMTIITPYMKIWIFPPKEFIIREMKKSMEEGELPGSPEQKMERENEDGLTEEEEERIKQDKKFMKKVKKAAEKYGGNFEVVVQLKDYETEEIVFNIFAQVNEEDILEFKPIPPEEVSNYDAKVTIDFENIYELIHISETDMKGAQIESPPWVERKKKTGETIKDITNGFKMFFKVRKIISSAEYEPKNTKKDVQSIFLSFIIMMGKNDDRGPPDEGELSEEELVELEKIKENVWESKETITGEVIGV